MAFTTLEGSRWDIERELNKISKLYKIKNYKVVPNVNSNSFLLVIEYLDKNEERLAKIESIQEPYIPSMVTWIDKMFEHSFKKEWFETYWAFDIHGTVLEPNHRKLQNEMNYYPYAKETLQLLTKRSDIILIMSTSSYPEEIDFYKKEFAGDDIIFDYINENPEIDSTKGNFGYYINKYYFNVLFEDKAGFNPLTDWKPIYELLKSYQDRGYLPSKKWSTKF